MMCETGLALANASSTGGMVSVGTNALDRNVSGNITISEIACTPWALRPTVPNQVKIQASDQPEMTASRIAAAGRLVNGSEVAIDYPVTGIALAGLAAWQLTVDGGDREAGARLLALARAFSYNRWFPVMAWEPLVAHAEAAAPGRLASWVEAYDGKRGRDLRGEVSEALAGVTSSG